MWPRNEWKGEWKKKMKGSEAEENRLDLPRHRHVGEKKSSVSESTGFGCLSAETGRNQVS